MLPNPRAAVTLAVLSMFIILSEVTAAVPRAETASDDHEKITVETWNIRQDNPGDGPHAWPKRSADVIEHLRKGGVDVISLQEVLPQQLAAIRNGLPEYAVFARSRERDANRGEAVPILWRRDRWRLDDANAGHFWLSETPEVPGSMSWKTACTRMATVVRLLPIGVDGVADASRSPIWVCSVHLDHRSAEARLEGARLIVRRLAGITADHSGEPVVVMGDFNATPGSPPIEALCAADAEGGYVDAWGTITDRAAGAPRGTWNGWKVDARSRRIDLVLVRGVVVVSADILHPTNDAGPLSDHWPVRAVLASPVDVESTGD